MVTPTYWPKVMSVSARAWKPWGWRTITHPAFGQVALFSLACCLHWSQKKWKYYGIFCLQIHV